MPSPMKTADKRAAQNLKRLIQSVNTDRALKGQPKMTHEDLGYAMGMGQSAVSQFVRGVAPCGLAPTLKFARALGVDPREIRGDLKDLNWALEFAERG